MENSSMIKIGPLGASADLGNIWDDKGRSEIVQIFVSHDNKIHSLQFQYANDNGELVLSDTHGHNTGGKYNVVTLNYPSEYINSISGKYGTNSAGYIYLTSITFGTNLGTLGPFGEPSGSDHDEGTFMLHLGSKRQFGGFHGTTDRTALKSIGMYVKPISTLDLLKEKDVPKLHDLNKDAIVIN